MAPISGYFDTVFANSGDKTAVPDPTQGDGSISYTQGWTSGYSLPLTNPSAFPIDRQQTNQLFYDVTSALQQYQQHGTPPFITSSMNGGSPFVYGIGDRVIQGGVVYTSTAASNASTPPSASWSTDSFTISSNNGYARLPSGLIIQWMHLTGISDPASVTLPLTFPNINLWSNACYGAAPGTSSPVVPGGPTISATSKDASTSIIRFSTTGGPGYGVNLLAIGY